MMKNKTKLILGLASLLGVTAAVGATAGFAWFTTVRTASLSVSNAKVYTNDGDLGIAYTVLDDSGSLDSTGTSGNTVSLSYKNSIGLTDVSADLTTANMGSTGPNFYKPVWAPSDGSSQPTTATSIGQVTNSGTNSFYIRFGLTLTNSGKNAFDVVIEKTGTTVSGTSAEAARMAIYDATNSKLATVWQPTAEPNGTSYQYLKKDASITDSSKGAYQCMGFDFGTLDTTTNKYFHAGDWKNDLTKTADLSGTNATADNGQIIATVPGKTSTGNGEVDVDVALWIEGTSSYAVNRIDNGDVSLSLALSAIDVAA